MSSTRDFSGPIGSALSVNLNATGDTEIVVPAGSRKFIITRIVVTNASASLAAGSLQYGIFQNALEAGEVILANGVNSATSLTAASKFISPTVAQDDSIQDSSVHFHVEVANGTAATADVYLYGVVLA